ncbi:SPOR domain-containing protein [Caenimonas sp. SL110]|uniref:SPOR domain-containing protein n=1 Tax=Caenimonas sp. SL110 TaxID=1450524 RepID=UPI000654551D|nr:SPOR domain-containing protein [Caenimonas sp. SL110]
MPFFKFRKSGDEPAATQQPAESVEAMRRRARHRLIGAGLLVLIGVVGFPMLFDTQPRPIAVDIPIEIPDRNKARPLAVPAQPASVATAAAAASGQVTTTPVAAVPVAPQAETPAPLPMPKAEAPVEPKPEPKVAAVKPEAKPEVAKSEPKPEAPKAQAKADDGAKARALLEGKSPEAASSGRYVVQVGAFADATIAREARMKLERAGLKTYTNVAETKDGKRTRVRVGPFATKEEATRAADKIKGLDLPAAILTL